MTRVQGSQKPLGFIAISNQFSAMKLIFLPMMVLFTCLLAGCQTPSPELTELNNHFTFHGHPVNPRAVENLTTWISDEHPGPVAIDMAGTLDSNRYFGQLWRRDGLIGFNRTDEGDTVFDSAMFAYRYVGRLSNGVHVLMTVSDGGGSGVFESILLVKFVRESAFDESGKSCHRIVMKQMGELPLGDRVDAKVKVHGNIVAWKLRDGSSGAINLK